MQRMARAAALLALGGWVAGTAGPARAISITSYSSEANDRFSSGFAAAPVANSSASFVGAGFDFNGVAWDPTNTGRSWGFLTPKHLALAQHYVGSTTVNYVGASGAVRSTTRATVTNAGVGLIVGSTPDLAVGTLTQSVPTSHGMPRYAILDLNSTSTAASSYNGLSLFLYGFGASGPRVGSATVSNTFSDSVITTTQASVQFQEGDSGSPVLYGWTNPVGGKELTILGVNSATGTVSGTASNIMSFLGNPNAMAAVNAITTTDGYALRVQGNVNAVWTGATNSSISLNGNWSGGGRTDQYVGFQSGGATPTTVNMNASATLRGLYFAAGAGASQGFTFSGANVLTIGRGGLTNYTGLRQTFSAALALGDHQYWDVGAGGVTAGAINTNGWLLEIAGSGTARITGNVSGTGGLALSGHRLELTGSSSYAGKTWVHAGILVVNGNIAASSGVTLAAGAALGGSGRVGAISGSGSVGPGNSPGILTAPSVDGSGGLDFSFEFGQTGAPIWSDAAASVNDVLRLNGATPFLQPLTAVNVIDIFLGVESVSRGSTFQGGFFTDASADFLGSLEDATFNYYVLGDGLGTARTYNAQGYYLLDTSFWAAFDRVDVSTVAVALADFAGGDATNGRVMQLVVVPEPTAIALAAIGLAAALLVPPKC